MISENTIHAVRNLDIETILKPYVKLTRKGSSLVGLCPFHSEKTGSFSVSHGKNLYHCFGCGRGGDGISFVMEKEGMSFTQAVEKIASDHNIPIEHIDTEKTDEERDAAKHKESLLAAIEQVYRYPLPTSRLNT